MVVKVKLHNRSDSNFNRDQGAYSTSSAYKHRSSSMTRSVPRRNASASSEFVNNKEGHTSNTRRRSTTFDRESRGDKRESDSFRGKYKYRDDADNNTSASSAYKATSNGDEYASKGIFRSKTLSHLNWHSCDNEDMRIAKKIAHLGYCSRRDAEELVTSGKVSLNDVVVRDLATTVGYKDKINVDNNILNNKKIALKVFLFHKPRGYITTDKDTLGRPTVFDLIAKKFGRLITVGRLDINTEGLLLLTNNGEFARQMELPANRVCREYRVRVFGAIDIDKLRRLRNGVTINGVNYGEIIVTTEKIGKGNNSWIRVAIFEGKNREIRKVMDYVGLRISRLIRISYGIYHLSTIPYYNRQRYVR